MIPARAAFIFAFTMVLYLPARSQTAFNNFITAHDGRLWDGDRAFRFLSFNIPNLNYVEDELAFDREFPYRMPDAFEINDALESIRQLGGSVVRIYTIPVRNIKEKPYPTYVLAPGSFDENSFKTLDTVLALSAEKGIRIIIPFVNGWQWMGGRPQYADFRNKTEDDFWTDSTIIEDVKATIKFVIERKNTVTGVAYKDDKTILCWETGNELLSPPSWTRTMAKYIKSLDSNHLLMDGFNAFSGIDVQQESLLLPEVDILSTHHYEVHPGDVMLHIDNTLKQINRKKAYVVGEFGFLSTSAIEEIIDQLMKRDVAGALTWSLRYHRREGGFYWHSEPAGMGLYKAYHWPGFTSGDEYDETNYLAMIRRKAFEFQGKPVPEQPKPAAPVLLPIADQSMISWQGSVGVKSYDVERSENASGPWTKVGYDISDAEVQYFPLFNDTQAETGRTYFYRVLAKNISGTSEPSNVSNPVKSTHHCLVDNMRNFGTVYSIQGGISIKTDNDRAFREVMYRFEGEAGASVTYIVPGKLGKVRVYAFSESNEPSLEFFTSPDNVSYSPVTVRRETVFAGKGDYGYWVPSVYTAEESGKETSFIKIVFKAKSQVARVEGWYVR